MKRPTQTDVARIAGVSRATVSYVVNDLTDSMVSGETRERVLKAIDELGYQPDAMAQSLRSGSTSTIGLLIPDMDNPHYWHIAKGVETVTQAKNFDLLLISASLDKERERHGVQVLSQRRIDGLILFPTYPQIVANDIERLTQKNMPLVSANSEMQGVDTIHIHEHESTEQIMNHLFSLGHRRIGFIFGVATPSLAVHRLDTYQYMLQENAYGNPIIEFCGPTIEEAYQATRRVLNRDPRPTALLVINDLLAIGALRAIADENLRIPDEISVASFDDITLSNYMTPRLTTVGLPSEKIGQVAADMIFKRLENRELPQQQVELSSYLAIRESTGPVPHEE